MTTTRLLLWTSAFGLLVCPRLGITIGEPVPPSPTPNVIVVFCDDLGYADVGVFGARGFATPHLDRLAAEGIRLTRFYAAQGVCSASRAALLTGCYPNRIGIAGALGPNASIGIHPQETTLGELVKPQGYATGIFGKWHLGDRREFLPVHHGFDEFLGLPYSNDMWPNHPEARPGTYPPLPLIEADQVKELMPDQTQLTTRYTERAVRFIQQNRDRPFLLYLAHSMPHVPLFVSDKFKGATAHGLYGDVVAEIDWSVGQIADTLKHLNLDDRTLLIFTSDNGPWLSYGNHAGSTGLLREGKGTAWEGGVRVPFIARWTGQIPAGAVCREPAMTIDILPTIAPSPRILIEAGTPFIKREGVNGIRALRQLWSGHIVADLKTMDGALGEVDMVRQAGANSVTVLGSSPTETLDLFVAHCQQLGLLPMIDMLGVADPLAVLRPLKQQPSAAVVLHRGRDEESTRGKVIQYRHVNRIRSKYDVLISAAGGVDLREARSAIFNGANIIVVNLVRPGDAWQGISTEADVGQIAQEFLQTIE